MQTYKVIIYSGWAYKEPMDWKDLDIIDIETTVSGIYWIMVTAENEEDAKKKVWEFYKKCKKEEQIYIDKLNVLREQFDIVP